MTAGAAALALGYVGTTGQLPDFPDGHPARELGAPKAAASAPGAAPPSEDKAPAAPSSGGAREVSAASGGAVLAAVAALLPSSAPVGAREVPPAALAALARAASALGLGCVGEARPEVLRAAVKGAPACMEAGEGEGGSGVSCVP